MNKYFSIRLALFSIFSFVAFASEVSNQGDLIVKNQNSDEAWVASNYSVALDLVLPNDDEQAAPLSAEARWRVTVRLEPPYDRPELGLSMTKSLNGKVEAVVVGPQRDSILAQLRLLRTKDRTSDVEQLAKQLQLNRKVLTGRECAGLYSLASSFEKIRIPANVEDDLRVDEVGYVIWTRARWGNSLRIRMGGVKGARQSHPLLLWVERFRRTVLKCDSSP